MLTRAIKRVLRTCGIDVRRYTAQSSPTAQLAQLLKCYDVDCVFDVGANTGQYARELRDLGYRGQIISFEPLEEAHSALAQESGLDGHWIVAPAMALGDFDGESEINVAGNLASSSIRDMTATHVTAAPISKYVRKEKILVRRLDGVFAQYAGKANRPFLKIDTQGFEAQVLTGAGDALHRFAGIQVEMSLCELYAGQELLPELIARLSARDFCLVGLVPGLVDPNSGHLLQTDGLFVRKNALKSSLPTEGKR